MKNRVFPKEASLLGFGKGMRIATINQSGLWESWGKIVRRWLGISIFVSAHYAYICLRDRKLISSYPDFFFFLFLLLPVLFSGCSSSSSLRLSEGGGLGRPRCHHRQHVWYIKHKAPLFPLPSAQQYNFIGAWMPLPYISKSFTLSSVTLLELFWAF